MIAGSGNCSFDWYKQVKSVRLTVIFVKARKLIGIYFYYSYRKASTGSSFDAFFAG